MRRAVVSVAICAVVSSVGCGATREVSSRATRGNAITNATIQFNDRDHGKDAKSAVDLWLLRDNANEIAHLHSVGVKFDDHASIAPMPIPVSGTFYKPDVDNAQLRIRLTPDGADDWSFEPRLTLTYADSTTRTYAWPQVMLDRSHPEITLRLESAVHNP